MVCLDLSNMDNLLLGYLKYLSTNLQIKQINIVHVMEDFDWDDELLSQFPDLDDRTKLEQLINDELKERADHHFENSGIKIRFDILPGVPTKNILKILDKADIDLLVLGKKTQYRGQGILSKKIARYAHVPVLFVPETVSYKLIKILVPVKFKKPSARAVKYAYKLAKVNGSNILLQHVYDYPKQYFPFIPDDSYTRKMEKHLEQKYQKFIVEYDLPELKCIFTPNKAGKAEDEIYNISVQEQADLIISGARGKTSTAALLVEEQAEHMANYNFKVPLLIYKEKAEHEGFLKLLLDELR